MTITFSTFVVPTVMENTGQNLLSEVSVLEANNVLRIIVTVLVGYDVGRFHVAGIQTSS